MEVSGGHSTIYTSMYGVVVVELTSRSGFHFSAFAFHSLIRYPNNLRRSIGRWCEVSLPQLFVPSRLNFFPSDNSDRVAYFELARIPKGLGKKEWHPFGDAHAQALARLVWQR